MAHVIETSVWSTAASKHTLRMDVEREQALAKAKARAEAEEYLASRPELTSIVTDFVSACLAARPEDCNAFAKQYFKQFQPRVTHTAPQPTPRETPHAGDSQMASSRSVSQPITEPSE